MCPTKRFIQSYVRNSWNAFIFYTFWQICNEYIYRHRRCVRMKNLFSNQKMFQSRISCILQWILKIFQIAIYFMLSSSLTQNSNKKFQMTNSVEFLILQMESKLDWVINVKVMVCNSTRHETEYYFSKLGSHLIIHNSILTKM